jgi:GntR family transcriptional regulator
MIDLQPDSPVPIHEQLAGQLMAAVASGAIKAGARLPEYRAFAQQLLTNPQSVARAYSDLEAERVLKKHPGGGMEVAAGADVVCRSRLQDLARQAIRQAVRQGLAAGLVEADIHNAVEQALAVPPARPLAPGELHTAIKKTAHVSHRDSSDIQILPPADSGGPP